MRYNVQKEDNKKNDEYLSETLSKVSIKTLETQIDVDNILLTKMNIRKALNSVELSEIENIFIDITGMTNYLIIQTIYEVNKVFKDKVIYILYTEAVEYFPTLKEVHQILETYLNNEEYNIQKRSELGISEVGAKRIFILPDFNGRFRDELPICLMYFVGYEPLRTKSMIEQYHPDLIMVCYCRSPHKKFQFRTNLSIKLHKGEQVFSKYRTIKIKNLSTFHIEQIISKLEKLLLSSIGNKLLYENYNMAISPQCSKLQAVASYLFCMRHPEVQLVFCIPGKFKPERYSKGIGTSWIYRLNYT